MGSSAKKKREKKKDFQVRECQLAEPQTPSLIFVESEVESGKNEAKGGECDRYEF
jgi:hypothetical protein